MLHLHRQHGQAHSLRCGPGTLRNDQGGACLGHPPDVLRGKMIIMIVGDEDVIGIVWRILHAVGIKVQHSPVCLYTDGILVQYPYAADQIVHCTHTPLCAV